MPSAKACALALGLDASRQVSSDLVLTVKRFCMVLLLPLVLPWQSRPSRLRRWAVVKLSACVPVPSVATHMGVGVDKAMGPAATCVACAAPACRMC